MKFRTIPAYVDAVQLTQDAVNSHVLDGTPLPDGCVISSSESHRDRREVYRAVVRLKLSRALVMPGDWVVCSEDDDFSVCKPDRFEATYEPANSPSPVTDAGLPCEFGGEE